MLIVQFHVFKKDYDCEPFSSKPEKKTIMKDGWFVYRYDIDIIKQYAI